jgi:hypothetical protein
VTPTSPSPASRELKGPRLVALFLLGVLMFNYPLLQLFARDGMLLGIPLLYCYVFCAWAVLIGLIALVVERRE